jgi:CRP-like cAMP-binding protein
MMIDNQCPFYLHLKTFGEFSDHEIEEILPLFVLKKVRKHQYLLQEGDISSRDFFVLRGMLRKYSIHNDKEWISQFATEGNWLSDHDSQLNQAPSDYYIDALENSEVLIMEASKLSALIASNAKFERYYRNEIRKTLIAQEKRIQCMQKQATNCYAEFLAKFGTLQQRISQTHIASFMGISRESLSRLKSHALKNKRKAG